MLTLVLVAALQQQPPTAAHPDRAARADSARGGRPQRLGAVVARAARDRRAGYSPAHSRSALKTDAPLRDTPQAISIVTSELIADQAMQGMGDVVRYVPGITMGQGEGHRDAPTIRGNASTADLFVDGVRDDAQYLRDLYNADRVEALKGANAMTFGRGGGGGVINRVTKAAGWTPTRSLSLHGGSFDHRRAALDVGQGLGATAAVRLNGVYERSGGFRDASSLRRFGVNPTATLVVAPHTVARLGYEYFDDARVVDRGIPSVGGRPSSANVRTFFGNPDVNRSTVEVHHAAVTVEHERPSGLALRNATRFSDYDKFYQNTFPGAVNAAATQVSLSAYNQAIARRNAFNQTDVIVPVATGAAHHTLVVGGEVGRQTSDQLRNTGYFDGTATSLSVPLASPTIATPVAWRQSASDADSRAVATVAAAHLQDRMTLGPVQALAGVRYDRFVVRYRNHRNGQTLRRADDLFSPRAGLVVKPVEPLSVYGSYGVSFLPSAGDQFMALTTTTAMLEPERFTSREVGVKWDALRALSFTGALFRLDRTNTSAPDPADATKVVQTGAQRTTGWEVGASGHVTSAWQVAGGWSAQRATIVSRTSAARAGATVPLVPHRTLSLWNRYQLAPALGLGLGVVRQGRMYGAIDNTVTLPAFTRLDAAAFVRLDARLLLQANVENLLDARYFATSHGNNNIMPGATRTVRLALVTGR